MPGFDCDDVTLLAGLSAARRAEAVFGRVARGTTQGPAWTTVTGMRLPSPAKTWVIPSFLPKIPFIIAATLSSEM